MSATRVSSTLTVLKPLSFQLQIFGLTSFSIRKDETDGYKCHVSFFNGILLFLSNLWFLHGIYFVTSSKELWEIEKSDRFSKFIDSFVSVVLIANCVTITFSIWWFFIIKSKFVSIFKEINKIDDELSALGSQVDYAKHRQYLCLALIFQNVFLTAVTVLAYLSAYLNGFYKARIFTSISEFIGFQYIYLLLVYFNFFILSITKRYQHINKLLKNAGKNEIVSVEFYEKLSMLFDQLVDVSDKVNFCFGIPVSCRLQNMFSLT